MQNDEDTFEGMAEAQTGKILEKRNIQGKFLNKDLE